MEIARFQYITQECDGASHAELALAALKGGARWVQARVKGRGFTEADSIVNSVKAACDKFGALLIVNDHVEIALSVAAHGVHLGRDDMSINEARRLLGSKAIIGATANCWSDIELAGLQGADYIGIGPYRFSKTKENLRPLLGSEGIATLAGRCAHAGVKIPLIAIGGVELADLGVLSETGVYGVAVASAVNLAGCRESAARKFAEAAQLWSS